jgi:hypothetical protein
MVETSQCVQVFGRLHDESIHARRVQASEKRQGTKSREVEHRRRSGLYGDLAAAGTVGMVDWAWRDGLVLMPARRLGGSSRCLAVAIGQG